VISNYGKKKEHTNNIHPDTEGLII